MLYPVFRSRMSSPACDTRIRQSGPEEARLDDVCFRPPIIPWAIQGGLSWLVGEVARRVSFPFPAPDPPLNAGFRRRNLSFSVHLFRNGALKPVTAVDLNSNKNKCHISRRSHQLLYRWLVVDWSQSRVEEFGTCQDSGASEDIALLQSTESEPVLQAGREWSSGLKSFTIAN